MGRAERQKGARGETEYAELLAEALGKQIRRKLGQARDGGDDIEIGPFRIEVKRRERVQVDAWCEQVEACIGPGQIPVVAYRRNGQPWRVVLRNDDFLRLMRGEL